MRCLNKNFALCLCAAEGDGRFNRLVELSKLKASPDLFFLWFPIEIAAVEHLIFDDELTCGKGVYDDARMKYIDPQNQNARKLYRNWTCRLLKVIQLFTGRIRFFLSGSNHDRYVIELIKSAQDLGIRCVVCEREGTGTQFTYIDEGRCLLESKNVTADYFIFANDGHKKMFKVGMQPSVRNSYVLGDLDTDWWFHARPNFKEGRYLEWNSYTKKVLFLTFGNRNYVSPYSFPNNPEFNWIQLLDEVEDEIFNFAKQNKHILIFYKMGHLEDNNPKFLKKCEVNGLKNVVPLDRSFSCNELIKFSDLIIGFQTTAIYEAMFTDTPILYPEWAIHPNIDRETMLLPIANSGAVTLANSKDEFKSLLTSWSVDDSFLSVTEGIKMARVKARETMFNNADGKIAERVWQKLIEIIGLEEVNLGE